MNHPNPAIPDNNFLTIQSAILDILNIHGLNIVDPDGVDEDGNQIVLDTDDHVIIEVHPKLNNEIYNENFVINYFENVPNLTIKSLKNTRIPLAPASLDSALCKIINYGTTPYDPVVIKGFDFINNNPSDIINVNDNDNDGNYGIYTSAINVFVEDCNFTPESREQSFVHDIYEYHPGYKPVIYLTVNGCKFEQDLGWNRFLEYARIKGFLDQPENASNSYIFNALNSQFINNIKSIEMNNSYNITMKENSYSSTNYRFPFDRMVSFFLENHQVLGNMVNVEGNYINNANNAFSINPKEELSFVNNIILNTVESKIDCVPFSWVQNNIITFDDGITYEDAAFSIISCIKLINNTFYQNPDNGGANLNLDVSKFVNNIVYGFDDGDINISNSAVMIANLFDSDLNFGEANLNISGIPSFTDIASNDFSLAWPSLAIGNGYSSVYDDDSDTDYDMKLLTYQDDTMDIGAIPFDQDRKQYHHFEEGVTTQNWTAFPALDPLNETTILYDGINQSLPNNNMIIMFRDFTDQLGNYATVWYRDWDSNGYVNFPFTWGNLSTVPTLVQPYLGYKITAQNDINHWFGGLIQDADMDIPIPGTSNEIWYGYHGTETVAWYIAFADILDDIVEIKHKEWNFVWTGTEWLGESYDNSYECALKTGDFVSISLRDYNHAPATFNWNILPMNYKIPIVYRNARSVSFIEEDDYTPIFVELGDNNSVEEVAVFVGDVCKGGVQTDSKSRVMIKAFLNDVPENTELSIVTFDGAKNKIEESQLIQYSENLAVWDNIKSLQTSNKNYYHIGIGENNDALLETASIVSNNYPNPFNPETTIEFNNPHAGPVSVDIYNIKGQLVKKLLNSDMPQGINTVIWKGTDRDNKQTASGIYFYKITACNNSTVTKKIILLK